MAWQSLEVTVSAEHAEAWSEALLDCGASSVSIEDAEAGTTGEQAHYGEPGMMLAQAWRLSTVAALFPQSADVHSSLAACAQQTGSSTVPEYRVRSVADEDWVRLTQAQFAPIEISRRLWIVPSWHARPAPPAVSVELDPGLAFGTGSHPTTRLCLAWLDRHLKGGETVLDYGCGSGILAIAALRLGAERAIGVDIDPQAVAAAKDNAARNGVDAQFMEASIEPDMCADIVIANILANPLKLLAPVLTAHCRVGGRLVLSGILQGQANGVIDDYHEHLALSVEAAEDGWVLLAGERLC
jgi:ribosomal protein L11 methyltransferase